MKYLLIFIWFIFSLKGNSQTDTVKKIKEAPSELKILIEELKELEKSQTEKDPILEIDGLLVENTITKSGNDFYDYFYRDWVAPPQAKNYTIFINEKPYRLSTTMVEVKINETLVFRSYLQPRNSIIESIAKQAVSQTTLYLINYEEIKKQLEGDDRSGNGIY